MKYKIYLPIIGLVVLLYTCINPDTKTTPPVDLLMSFTLAGTTYKHTGCASYHYTATNKTEVRSTYSGSNDHANLGIVKISWVDSDKTSGTKSATISFVETASSKTYEASSVNINISEYGTWPTPPANEAFKPKETELVKGNLAGPVTLTNIVNGTDTKAISSIDFICVLPTPQTGSL